MALPKKKPEADIALVFGGAPKKKPGDSGGDDGARSLLQAANPDVFTDDVLDALHEYVKDCMESAPSPDESDSMDMEGE